MFVDYLLKYFWLEEEANKSSVLSWLYFFSSDVINEYFSKSVIIQEVNVLSIIILNKGASVDTVDLDIVNGGGSLG